jgi:hypothetical protein
LACAEQIAWGKFGLGADKLLGIAWESAGLELGEVLAEWLLQVMG